MHNSRRQKIIYKFKTLNRLDRLLNSESESQPHPPKKKIIIKIIHTKQKKNKRQIFSEVTFMKNYEEKNVNFL